MGVYEGLLSGFTGRKAEVEQENLRQAEQANAREAKIYEALVNSPDPEIRSMAVTGLLDSAKPSKRKSGLRGWIGQMEANPALGRIKDLIGTPVTTTEHAVTPGLPSVQTSGYLSTPPGQQSSLAMPEGSAVTPDSNPMAQVQSNIQAEIAPGPAIGRMDTRTTTRPREVFRSPEDQMRLNKKAAAQGDVEGEVAGLVASGIPEQEARGLIAQKYRRAGLGSAPFQAIAGTMPDGSPMSAVFDRAAGKYRHPVTGEVLEGFVERQTGASAPRFGQNREAIAEAEFGGSYGSLNSAQQQIVLKKEQTYLGQSAQSRVEGTGAGKMNVPADLRTAQLTGQPVGTTPAQVAGHGVPTMAQQETRRTTDSVKSQLQTIRDTMLDVLPSDKDLIGGIAPGMVMMARRRDPRYRAKVAALEAAVNNVVNLHARGVGQQRGAQTEADAMRAEAAITSVRDSLLSGDTQESTRARIDQSLQFIDRILGRLPSSPTPTGAVGSPPPGARQTPGASGGLDAPVAGWFVDDAGNLVQR